MSNPKIKITQSLIKAMKDDFCPAQVFAVYIAKTAKNIPSESMLRGSYFEHLCLGAGHAHNDEPVTDLKRLKNGNKSVDQQRIEEQAEVFKKMCIDRPIVIKEKQRKIVLPYDDNYELEGTLDFTGMIDNLAQIAIVDLKLTSSLYHEKFQGGFGPWSWEHPYNMDFTQVYMYHYLYTQVEELKASDVAFYYIVFDYKPESEYKIIKKNVERMHIMELMESIRKTIDKIEFHQSSSWNYNPAYKNCIQCPLKNSCTSRILQKPIQNI